MLEILNLIDLTQIAGPLLADYQQPTLVGEETRGPAIRGFIIVGCFVVIPVIFAWFMQRCSDAYEARHAQPDVD